jgi:hypothetical protein
MISIKEGGWTSHKTKMAAVDEAGTTRFEKLKAHDEDRERVLPPAVTHR